MQRIRTWVDAAVNRARETDEAEPTEAVPNGAAPTEAVPTEPVLEVVAPTAPAPEREPLALTTTTAARFLLHLARLSAATADQLRAARSALETMLDEVDDHLRKHPEGGAGA